MNQYQHPSSASIAKQRLKQHKHPPENLTLDTIRSQLAHADTETCLKLIQLLDDLGTDAALDTLTELLSQPNLDADVHRVISAILLRQHPRYTQILHRLALNGDSVSRTAALGIIAADCGDHHVPTLALCLGDDQSSAIQDMAAQILQAIQTPESLEIVTRWRGRRFDSHAEAHHTQHAQQTHSTHHALAILASHHHQLVNHRQAFVSLIKHVRSGKWGDQQDAAKAVHRLIRTICGDPSADYRAIRQDFIDALDDPEHMVRWVVVEALARLQDPEAVPALVTRLHDPAWTVRVAVVRALIEIGDVAVVGHLAQMINDPNTTVQEAAIEAIGRLGSAQEVPLLTAVAASTRADMVRVVAIDAIGRLRGTGAVPVLLRLLDDPYPLIRWHTAMALSDLADETSVTALIQHLSDRTHPRWEEKRVCDWLIDGLQRINTPVASAAVKRWQQAST